MWDVDNNVPFQFDSFWCTPAHPSFTIADTPDNIQAYVKSLFGSPVSDVILKLVDKAPADSMSVDDAKALCNSSACGWS